jgi:hypothetical protein
MFARARAERLWFTTPHQNLWFSPDELAAEQAAGRFRWGPRAWSLENPAVFTRTLELRVEDAQRELERWKERLAAAGVRKR